MKYDYPPWPYFIFGSVAALAFVGDIRMLVRGGIAGTQRLSRHLWRMCFALFVAAVSIFLARQQLFPAVLQKTGALVFLSFLPLILLVFWMLRVRFAKAYKTKAKVGTQLDYAVGMPALTSSALSSALSSTLESSTLENRFGRL
jgi:amino acid permease